MNIRCLGCNSIYDSSSVFRRAATGEYMIMLTKSRCRFDINGLTMRVPQDAFIICDGRLPVVYSAEDCPLICDWICFDGEDEREFIDALERTLILLLSWYSTALCYLRTPISSVSSCGI